MFELLLYASAVFTALSALITILLLLAMFRAWWVDRREREPEFPPCVATYEILRRDGYLVVAVHTVEHHHVIGVPVERYTRTLSWLTAKVACGDVPRNAAEEIEGVIADLCAGRVGKQTFAKEE